MRQATASALRLGDGVGKAEVDLGLGCSVALGLGERLLIERNRFPWADNHRHRAGKADQNRGPGGSRGRRLARLLELSDRAAAVACLAVPVRADEDAPARVLDVAGRREPDCQLGELGGGGARSTCVHALCRLLDDGGDLAARPGRGEPEMASSFLDGRSDLREPSMQGSPARGRLTSRNSRSQQRMGEAQPVSVELENPSGKQLCQPCVEATTECRFHERGGWVGERGDHLRDLERRRAEAVEPLVHELVEVGGDR